jgi:hypothetical protein
VRAIEVPRIPEIRVFLELSVKVQPVIGVRRLGEHETEDLQNSLDLIEMPAANNVNCIVEGAFPGLFFCHSHPPQPLPDPCGK